MDIGKLEINFDDVWEQPLIVTNNTKPEKHKKKQTYYLGKFPVEPQNQVIFTNGTFFVERTSQFLIIRPTTQRRYIKKVRKSKRTVEITKSNAEILIPLPITTENPELWFKQNYLDQTTKRNSQTSFIKTIWKYKDNIFKEVMMG